MLKKSLIDEQDIPPSRLETLVDGVFAIAMTLLVLDIRLPETLAVKTAHDLWLAMAAIVPSMASFAVSFIILGMFWVGHHTEFHYIKRIDHKVIWFNIFYLLLVSFVPFSASLLGKYPYNQAAIVTYGLNVMCMVLIHYFLWRHVANNPHLIKENTDARIHLLVNRLAFFATLAYVLAMVLAFWHPGLALIIYAIVPLPYIFGWIYRLS